ncbi:MAG: elongation factor G [Deltaproteobacteria bacterium]|nr:elongation factor G [Deltaproteobacteria bacterium]
MKVYNTKDVRNVAFVGQRGSGKTSICEAMLFDGGMVTRLCSVDEGNSNFDFEPEEIKRTSTIQVALGYVEWSKKKVNVIDTPGASDFMYDTKMAMKVADSAVVVISATDGVMVNTEKVWGYADQFGLPRAVFVSKMDQERSDFDKVLAEVREQLSRKAVAFQVPIGKEQDFKGVVDLLSGKAFLFDDGGKKVTQADVPADLKDTVDAARLVLVEMVAESDDELMEKYLEGEELTVEELNRGLRTAVANGDVVPVLCGSGKKNMGIQSMLDLAVDVFPCPDAHKPFEATTGDGQDVERATDSSLPFSGIVFKTMGVDIGRMSVLRVVTGTLTSDSTVMNRNKDAKERFSQIYVVQGKKRETVSEAQAGDIVAVAKLKETRTGHTLCEDKETVIYKVPDVPQPVTFYAFKPRSKADEDRLGTKIGDILAEDITLRVERDVETAELVMGAMGQIHVDTTVERLRRLGVEVDMSLPKVPYREAIKSRVGRTEGKHKKQTGGRGQFGICYIEVEPLPRGGSKDEDVVELPWGGGFSFVDKIFGGSIPQQYRPSIEKGIRDRMRKGVIAGYPFVDIRVTLVDGKYHDVDSSDYAFQLAGSKAFQAATKKANPVLLEPLYTIEVVCPDDSMGDIMGDINSKRGRILGMEPMGKYQVIRAQVPLAEVQRYAADLDSLTQGRGSFSLTFAQYEEVPAQLAEKIIAESKVEEDEE